jgi:hypothetical protein
LYLLAAAGDLVAAALVELAAQRGPVEAVHGGGADAADAAGA